MIARFAAVVAFLTITACSTVSTPGAGNGSAGGGKATIDLTVSGAMAGSTTQLVGHDCAGAAFGSFAVTLHPILNGTEYTFELLIGEVLKTPVTRDLASQGNKVLLEINDQKTGTGGWRNNTDSTGTVTIDAGADSGSVDSHNLDNGLPGVYKTKLDLKLTFTCPAKK